jgi:hypothetical protein
MAEGSAKSTAPAPARPEPPDLPPTVNPTGGEPARAARQRTIPDQDEGSQKPSPAAVVIAFVISAGIGFGATLLAGHFLG